MQHHVRGLAISFFVAEDTAIWGLEDLGDCLIFICKDGREAAMRGYEFQKSLEEGMGSVDDEDKGTFDNEDNPSYSFTPPFPKYETADMSVQPGITVDKARTDLFIQFIKEFGAISNVIAKLPGES